MQTFTFPSSSNPSAVYTTTRNADGSLSCNCKGWTIKRGDGPRSCKHTRTVEGQVPAVARVDIVPAPVAPSSPAPAPMLASAMKQPLTGAAFDAEYSGWLMEEKHDGHRCVVVIQPSRAITAWSRPRQGQEAKRRELPQPVLDALAHFSPGTYDGELVVPGGNAWDVTALGSRLMFIVFDLLDVDGVTLTGRAYAHRRDMLLDQLAKLPNDQQAITTTRSEPATWARVEAIWKRGGEGAILKRPTSSYRPGYRSPEWVKVKAVNAATLTCYGFEEGKSGPYSKLMLRDSDGIETTVKVLTAAHRREIESNPRKWLGRRIVISFQQKTPNGSYRHGIFDHVAGEGE